MGVCVLWVCWIASLSAGRISFSALVLLGERATSSPYIYLCNFLKFVTYNFFKFSQHLWEWLSDIANFVKKHM